MIKLVDIPVGTEIPIGLIKKLPKRQNNTRDMTGWILGELRVIGYVGKVKEYTNTTRFCRLYWLCQCQCGRYRIIRTNDSTRVSKCRYCTIHRQLKKNPRKIGRDFKVNFRVFFNEREQLRKYAASLGISLQDFCLQTLLKETQNIKKD